MASAAKGYWTLAWIGLFSNITAIPLIGLVLFGGPPFQTTNISIGISLALPSAIVGIVGASGLLAERKWGVIVSIVALSMVISGSLPYGIVRLIIIGDLQALSGLSLLLGIANITALIYWCRPIHRKAKRL